MSPSALLRPRALLRALLLATVAFAAPSALRAAPEDDGPDPILERVDLRDVPLADACRILSDETGINIVPTGTAGVIKVSLLLRNVPTLVALDALCRAHGLWFQRDSRSGIVRIATSSEYQRDLTTIAAEQTEFFTLLYPNAYDVGYAIRNLFGDRVILRSGSGDADIVEDLENRFERFDLMDERTQGFGTSFNSAFNSGFGGGNGFGGNGFGNGGSGGNGFSNRGFSSGGRTERVSRVRREENDPFGEEGATSGAAARERSRVEASPDELTQIERILSGANVGEAERAALLASISRRGQVPIRVSLLRRQNRIVVRTADEDALKSIRTLVRRLDVPTSMVLLEMRILAIDLSDEDSAFFDYAFRAGDFAGGFSSGQIAPAAGGQLGVGGTGLRTGNMTFQVVSDNFAMRMQALESKNKVCVLATPLLLTANNEVSRLFVGREVPLNRSFLAGDTVTNANTTTTAAGSTQIEFRPVGTTVLITPSINSDRTVTLRVVQENSNADSTDTVLVPTATGFEPQEVNVVSSQTVTGTFVAKSELAVAFGGLIERSVTHRRDQVPLLGNVPLLGVLFRRNEDIVSRREIVIVVRPYVLSTPSESEAISHRLLEKLGVSSRSTDVDGRVGDPDHRTWRTPTARQIPFRFHGIDGDER